MLSLRDALTRATSQLSAHPDLRPSALQDAVVMLMQVLSIDRPTLIAHPERPVSREEQSSYQRLLERRLTFEPIQYILGVQEFYGLALRVNPAVLIPRPETELLVEAVISRLPPNARIVDVGTGSGAIAIAIAHSLPRIFATALDLSRPALAIARENAVVHGLQDCIRFLESDLLAAVVDEAPFDAIVSNPPYISESESPMLHPQVRDHEPAQALFSGPTGLEVYRRLIPQAFSLLKPGGLLAFEIGHGQRAAVTALLGSWSHQEFLHDLQKIPRVALARKP